MKNALSQSSDEPTPAMKSRAAAVYAGLGDLDLLSRCGVVDHLRRLMHLEILKPGERKGDGE